MISLLVAIFFMIIIINRYRKKMTTSYVLNSLVGGGFSLSAAAITDYATRSGLSESTVTAVNIPNWKNGLNRSDAFLVQTVNALTPAIAQGNVSNLFIVSVPNLINIKLDAQNGVERLIEQSRIWEVNYQSIVPVLPGVAGIKLAVPLDIQESPLTNVLTVNGKSHHQAAKSYASTFVMTGGVDNIQSATVDSGYTIINARFWKQISATEYRETSGTELVSLHVNGTVYDYATATVTGTVGYKVQMNLLAIQV